MDRDVPPLSPEELDELALRVEELSRRLEARAADRDASGRGPRASSDVRGRYGWFGIGAARKMLRAFDAVRNDDRRSASAGEEDQRREP